MSTLDMALKSPKVETIGSFDGITGTPWESVGTSLPENATAQETLELAGLDWEVVKAQNVCHFPMELPGGEIGYHRVRVPKSFALVRDSDKRVLSPHVGDRYKPVQNHEAFDVFRRFVQAGDMRMETAGSLRNGLHVWGLASLGDEFRLADGELIKGYFLLVQSHLYGNSLRAMFTPIRYPGGHTLVRPVKSIGRGGIYRMPHSRAFNETRKDEIMEVLGVARQEFGKFCSEAKFLADVQMPERVAVRLFAEIFDPKLVKETRERNEKLPPTLDEVLASESTSAPLKEVSGWTKTYAGADLPSCDGTAWGYYQTIAFALDHAQGMNVNTRLDSAWFGKNAKRKEQAFKRVQILAALC